MLPSNAANSFPRLAASPDDEGGAASGDLVHQLTGENQALQSVLYGLCMGLSRMSDVHREVVAQAFEYAHGAPRSNFAGQGEQGLAIREHAFRTALGALRDAVTSRSRR